MGSPPSTPPARPGARRARAAPLLLLLLACLAPARAHDAAPGSDGRGQPPSRAECAGMRVTSPHHSALLPNDVAVTAQVDVADGARLGSAGVATLCEGDAAYSAEVLRGPLTLSPARKRLSLEVPPELLTRCKDRRMDLRVRLWYRNDTGSAPGEPTCTATVSVHVQSDHLAATYIVAASMSLVGCVVMMYLYLRYPLLRAWPSTMVFWRTFCHLLLALCFLYINAWEVSDHHTDATCNFLIAAFTQLALLGSIGWYFCLALNFYFSISNPFRRPQSLLPAYHTLVWSASICTAAYTMLNWGYRVDFQLCWITKQDGINVSNWVVYGIWLVVVGFVSIVIMVIGWVRLSSSRRKRTFETRMTSLRQTRIYVVVFSIYWVILSILWGVVAVTIGDDVLVQDTAISTLFAVVIGGIGVVDVGAWVYIQWEPLQESRRREEEEGELSESAFRDKEARNFDDISDALRHEFIAVISQGLENATDPNNRVRDDAETVRFRASASSVSHDSRRPATRNPDLAYALLSDAGGGAASLSTRPSKRDAMLRDLTWTDMSDDTYQFTSYGEGLFRDMREHVFGVRNANFRRSVGLVDDHADPESGTSASGDGTRWRGSVAQDRRDAKIDKMVQHFSEGASGSFFYFTLDKRYMIKTLPEAEAKLLLRILPAYKAHMAANRDSLISRFFGLYSVRMYGHTQFVVVMNNALRVPSGYKILEKYDLKGSTVKRHGKLRNGKGTRKDNDLSQPVQIGRSLGEHIKAQSKRDTAFLRDQNIMDYSLLMGVHVCSELRTGQTHCGGLPLPTMQGSRSGSAAPSPVRPDPHAGGYGYEPAGATDLAGPHPSYGGGAIADDDDDDCDSKVEMSDLTPRSVSHQSSHRGGGGGTALGGGGGGGGFGDDDDDDEAGESRDSRYAVIKSTRLCGPGVYHFAIIDLLQEWTWEKKLERWFKILFRFHCHDALWISAVEPKFYHARFCHMLERVFEYNEDATLPIRPVTTSLEDENARAALGAQRKSAWFSMPTRLLGRGRGAGAGAAGANSDGAGGSGGAGQPVDEGDLEDGVQNAAGGSESGHLPVEWERAWAGSDSASVGGAGTAAYPAANSSSPSATRTEP